MNSKCFILLAFTLLNCGERAQNANPEKLAIEQIDNSEKFLELFKEFEPSDLHVYPPSLCGESIDSLFKGRQIDLTKFTFLDKEDNLNNIQSYRKGKGKLYAVGKFEIDENTLALLFGKDNQCSTVIELTFWDKNSRAIIKGTNVAEFYGDDFGWYFDTESWINHKPGASLEIITRRKDVHYDDGLDLTAETDSLFKQVFNNRLFVQVRMINSDTVHFPLKRPPYIYINPDEYD